jgi:hypothetical protein
MPSGSSTSKAFERKGHSVAMPLPEQTLPQMSNTVQGAQFNNFDMH